jgi:hypothetical protein
MAAVASPYGLRPVNMSGSQYMTHGMRLMKIAAAYGTSIFNGDLVKLNAGYIEKDVATTGNLPIGVFFGCEYEDTAMGLFHRNFWTAGTVTKTNSSIWAYVIDDPDVLFEIQASGSVTQANLGSNANIVQTAGSLITGRSAIALNITGIAATATFPLRIVDFVRRPGSSVGDAFTDVIVRLNLHQNRTPTGTV